eukprot:m.330569 g.330569  ORF g.330569 m.330569 type:complete len:310 (+) comp55611_c0_seq3:2-931(+)
MSAADKQFDDELEELLNSALGDFEKPQQKAAQAPAAAAVAAAPSVPAATFAVSERAVDHAAAEQYALQLYTRLAGQHEAILLLDNLLGALNFVPARSMQTAFATTTKAEVKPAAAKTAASASKPSASASASASATATTAPASAQSQAKDAPRDFGTNLSHAYEELIKNSESMEDLSGIGDEDLDEVVKGMLGGDDLMPMMKNMMSDLFSKEVMYPSLTEIAGKYEPWIAANRDKISVQELSNYKNQHKCLQEMCALYETGGLSEADTTERIMQLMNKMQEFGTPPEGIAPPVPSMPSFGMPAGGQCPTQ